ncbi:MAG: methyltransferase domain-containing protein [Planctomycetes bacterium]|nr:methyltransferase domain-containing protein [Planctomycetota bacterium]
MLDLVISVDNSTVHLAGALGAPTWTLLPFSADWRWFLDRGDSPWYPSMRLLRQKNRGDWSGVMQETARLLGQRLVSECEERPERESPPPPSVEPVEEEDDDEWLKRNHSLRADPHHPNFPADRREFVVRRYEFAREFCTGKRVLDAACGTGFGSAILGEVAADVCGIDLDAKTVAYAAGHYGSRNVRFQQSCVELTPFAAADFDVIVSLETIEHTIAPQATMSELVRLLSDDGVLILSVPNAWGLTRHHFIDFDFAMLKELTQQFFGEQEFYYNNSGARGPGSLRGIGPLDEIDPADAECLLAVCRKPHKHLLPAEANRVQIALEQIYSSAFGRHVDYLSTQIRVGPFGLSADGELPRVFSGATLQLQADDFGDERGRVICQLESPILQWSPQSVTVQIPDVRLKSSVPAQLDVVSADGEVIVTTAIRLVPQEETGESRLADSA